MIRALAKPLFLLTASIIMSSWVLVRISLVDIPGSPDYHLDIFANKLDNISKRRPDTESTGPSRFSKPGHHRERNSSKDENSTIIQKILIVAYFKSGSGFLGKLLTQMPYIFYHDEPLYVVSQQVRKLTSANATMQALTLLHKLLSCNYEDMRDYAKWIVKRKQLAPLLTEMCPKNYPHLCSQLELHSAICHLCPRQLVRETRLLLQDVNQLMVAFPKLLVVHLVRDPRGMYASRQKMNWRNYPEYTDPAMICYDIYRDLLAAKRLQRNFPQRFATLRFEDLLLNLPAMTKALFDFLNVPVDDAVSKYLRNLSLTKNKVGSTARNFTPDPNKWKKVLNMTSIRHVESVCRDVMQILGYKDVVVL